MLGYDQLTGSDTIIALSTPQGVGAIGVIRLSGPKAITLTNAVFKGKDLNQEPSHTLHFGSVVDGDEVLDEVVVSLFIAPHSYTKENVVEISCHGSPYIIQRVMELLIEQGARPAQPGEFTLRAFLNGRMDLSQAEAVADLIASNSKASHDVALQQMRGGFSHQVKQLREKLVHFASMVELELDFAEEDVEFANRDDLKQLVSDLQHVIGQLIMSFKLGNVIKNGVSTVIAGRPNAGKSTLLNRLLKEDRAIVSEIAGTTRDTIEEVVNIQGILFRLIDTAGIREATDTIEQLGVEKTFQKIDQSALIVYLFDVTKLDEAMLKHDITRLKRDGIPVLVVGNKIDLLQQLPDFKLENPVLYISSKNDQNIHELEEQLVALAAGNQTGENSTIVTNARHYQVLLETQTALNDVLNGLDLGVTGDLLALDIRRALHALGEITGDITTDDLLDNIFSKFCIGK